MRGFGLGRCGEIEGRIEVSGAGRAKARLAPFAAEDERIAEYSVNQSDGHAVAEQLRRRGLESIQLAIELFNRPSDCARIEAVLILAHHSFEMVLKSIIVEKTGTVIDTERGFSYSFDTCLRLAEESLGLLTGDQRRFLSMLDNLRDSAMHYYQEISEPILYVFAQGSVSLFNELIRAATNKGLIEFLPNRVLPISSIAPSQIAQLLDDEFDRLRNFISQPDMDKRRAIAMLRPLMAFKIGGEASHRRMTISELDNAIDDLAAAPNWRVVFPEIAQIKLESAGDGIIVGFKVVKESPDAIPVRILRPEDTCPPGAMVIQKEINIFDKFSLSLTQLSDNLGITGPRARALIKEYRLQDDPECFREVVLGSQHYKRYSKKTLDFLRGKLGTLNEVWQRHRSTLSPRRRPRSRG
ncbi:MAG: hypothetical protein AMXMBFR47_30300 [Planctomycetota bacterium]